MTTTNSETLSAKRRSNSDLGAHLTLPSGNAAIGESFRVQGPGYDETFTFTTTADPLNINEILALPSDSAAELAARASAHLDAVLGGFRMTLATGGSLEGESFRFNGVTFTYTSNPSMQDNDILAEFGDSPATMAARTAGRSQYSARSQQFCVREWRYC